jgi:hypothetical protein
VQQVVASEVKDVARVVPVGEGAGDDGEEHVILPAGVDDFGRPERVVGLGQWNVGLADVLPVRASVGGFGDADVRAVNPGDTVFASEVGAAIGVQHPPRLARAVPDDDRIGCTIVDWIAEEGNGCGSCYTCAGIFFWCDGRIAVLICDEWHGVILRIDNYRSA